jgi:mannitol/fructose-specific phosphotransferase system IIA component (Ntr-type)
MDLEDIFIQEAIQAKLDLHSRDEVIQKAGELLAAAKAVRPEYIDAMKRVMDELGPYCVIAPGIALLHARPEDGVNRSCLALITLKSPVPFGHSSNDPVDLAFALGAVDKQNHIKALAELADYLSNEDFLQLLRESLDSDSLRKSIFSYIKSRK